jgi:hypothetical protein
MTGRNYLAVDVSKGYSVFCDCDHLRKAESFSGWADFDKFKKVIENNRDFSPLPVALPYANPGLEETWYQRRKYGSTWRLVEPDPPFAGLWKKVS